LLALAKAKLMSHVLTKVLNKEERSFQLQTSPMRPATKIALGQDIYKCPMLPANSEASAMSTPTLQISRLPRKNYRLNSISMKLIKLQMLS